VRAAVLGAALALAGCGWWSAGGSSTVATGAGQIAACVIGQATQGVTDPTVVLAACVGATLADVVSIVESLIAYYAAQNQDGGTQVSPAPVAMAKLYTLAASARKALQP
jgi:hypothetical protein